MKNPIDMIKNRFKRANESKNNINNFDVPKTRILSGNSNLEEDRRKKQDVKDLYEQFLSSDLVDNMLGGLYDKKDKDSRHIQFIDDTNLKNNNNELNKVYESLGFLEKFLSNKIIRLTDENKELVCRNIDKIEFDKYIKGDHIIIFVVPSEKNVKVDWSKLLNSITGRGYKVSIKIDCLGQNINTSNEKEDIVLAILKEKEQIKNKDLIKIGYYYEKSGKNYNEYELNISEYNNVEEALDLCVSDIEAKGFSPLEKLIAAYKVTVGMFMGNLSEEKGADSYDKYSSIMMFPDVAPTCQVHTQLFEALCNKLNIPCKVFKYRSKRNENHVVDIVQLKDDKYNIDGVYSLNITGLANGLNSNVVKLTLAGKKINNYLSLPEFGYFCIGKESMKENFLLHDYDDSETLKKMNLSDKNLPKEALVQAEKVVNEATITNIRKK